MRHVPTTFTGFICGEYVVRGETISGAMEYVAGTQRVLHVPAPGIPLRIFHRSLKRGGVEQTIADGMGTRTMEVR